MIISSISRIKHNFKSAVAIVSMSILASCGNFGGGGIGGSDGPQVDLDKPVVVALLVPKGGQLDSLGRAIEAGAELALAERNRGEIDLRVYSTGGDPARAAAIAAQAREAGAALIVGPLKTEEVHAVDSVVELPILSFSNNADAASEEAYILGNSFANLADRIGEYTKSIGRDRVGIVFDQGLSGEQGAKAMVASAENNGLNVVSSSSYPLSVDGINTVAPTIASRLKTAEANAVFFTDTPPRGLPLITEALTAQGVTSTTAQYAGISRWDTPPATLQLPQLQGGVFADIDPATAAAFNARYRAATGSAPHELSGIGYDGVAAAIALVRDARKTRDRTPFGDKDIRGLAFDGAYGKFEFDKDHHAERALAVMRVSGGQLQTVSPAKR